jgi:hypothetical protein
MKISISEGLALAEHEAWRTKGKQYSNWFTWGKRLVPLAVLAGILGAVGYGGWALIGWVGRSVGGASAPGVDFGTFGATWFVFALLCFATIIGLRVASRATRFLPAAATYLGLVIAWCGAIAFAFGAMV